MKKLLFCMLLTPFMAFSSQSVDLTDFWLSVNKEEYSEAKYQLGQLQPCCLDDVLYIKLCNMYLGMKMANKNKVKRMTQEIDQEIDAYFSLIEEHLDEK